MTTIPLATSDWRRDTADEPVIKVQNRFFEENPTNLVEGSSLIARPGFQKFNPPFQNYDAEQRSLRIYTQEGIFNDNIFVMKPTQVLRKDGSAFVNTNIARLGYNQDSYSGTTGSFVGRVGTQSPYFYYLGSNSLFVYPESSFGLGTLTRTGTILATAVVQLGSTYYEFTSGSVDSGSPNGSSGSPWLVALGSGTTDAMGNLALAIDGLGVPGVTYSTALSANTFGTQVTTTSTTLEVRNTAAGNLTQPVTTTSSTLVLSWGAGTLTGGGGAPTTSYLVPIPSDSPAFPISIGTINSYLIIATTQAGKFYWINPGETTVDPLNFASAELIPDSLLAVRIIGDQIWFLGRDSIEIWQPTGDLDAPFRRASGRAFNYGVVDGSDCVIDNSLVLVSTDNAVYQFDGTSVNRISNNGIEERIRKFLTSTYIDPLNSECRTWPLWSDGHVYYVLNLGTTDTIVYDLTTQQWADWSTEGHDYLRPHTGETWSGGAGRERTITADTLTGALWFVNEDYRLDDIPNSDTHWLIPCWFTAGVPMRLRETARCNQVYITGSVGEPIDLDIVYLTDDAGEPILTDDDGAWLADSDDAYVAYSDNPQSMSLEYSDDNGKTWKTPTPVGFRVGDFSQEIVWRSLGHIRAPGRIFRFFDYAMMKRVDGMDML